MKTLKKYLSLAIMLAFGLFFIGSGSSGFLSSFETPPGVAPAFTSFSSPGFSFSFMNSPPAFQSQFHPLFVSDGFGSSFDGFGSGFRSFGSDGFVSGGSGFRSGSGFHSGFHSGGFGFSGFDP